MQYGEQFNCLTHLLGLVLALFGAVWLLSVVSSGGSAAQLVGAAVFFIATVLLYLLSFGFHASREPSKKYWQKFDHCSIFIMIAGTVTPFVLKTEMNRRRMYQCSQS
ncbi:hemolysin III (plasmid) [Advenella kashmirensis WT001]|uniref:Hemolysin III n=1 Tax=Advenella kashmirensis (strain DSM 17095 / LMG 22695 / WT001) TaxID=1036672 RepID=I3UI29_ADVKW|nr:hemolysin III family protein [Advenella kashmirensis]AFK64667.1 hemolysin III [Advenella kashmirensis WT001]